MCAGIAVYWRDFPVALVERHELRERVIVRCEGAEPEVQFLHRAIPRLIPAWHEGQLSVYLWGRRDRRNGLPTTGWARVEDVEAGRWTSWQPEPVLIPACFGYDKGVWFQIKESIRGILIRDELGQAHVYMLTAEASHYYQVMTGSDRMPVLIGERI
jgi:hypothetical protein